MESGFLRRVCSPTRRHVNFLSGKKERLSQQRKFLESKKIPEHNFRKAVTEYSGDSVANQNLKFSEAHRADELIVVRIK